MLDTIKTINFPNTVNLFNGNFTVSEMSNSINQQLGLLLLSSKGELMGDPDFGTNIHRYIFNHNNLITDEIVRNEILSAVKKYLPRIYMDEEDISIEPSANKVTVILTYSIRNSNISDEYTLVYLKEGGEEEYGY